MPQFLKKLSIFKTLSKKQTVLGLLIFALLGLLYPLASAQAAWWNVFTALPSLAIALIFQIILLLAQGCLMLANFLLGLMIKNPFKVSFTNPATNPVIEIGWTLLRDVANMFFILGLAYIGLATALNLAGFQTKKAFAKILLIALIINFTPVICGVIVDMSHIFAKFFLQGINFGSLIHVFVSQYGTIWGHWYDLLLKPDVLLSAVMLMAYGFIGALILFLFAMLLFIRPVIIWILVILSPIAFFAWIFDETKKYFTMWWNWFLQWSTIVVPAAFFLYLSQVILINADKLGTFSPGDPSGGTFSTIGPPMVALVFLGIGFMIALQAASAASGAIMGAVGTVTKSVKSAAGTAKKLGKRAAQVGDAAARVTAGYGGAIVGAGVGAVKGAKSGTGIKGRISGAGKGLKTGAVTGAKMGWQAPGVAKEKAIEWGAKGLESAHLVRPGFYERIEAKRYKTAEAEERLKGLSDDKLKKIAERKAIGATEKGERAAAVKLLGQRGKFEFKRPDGTIDTEKEKKLIEQANKAGADLSDLAKSRPDLTPEINSKKFKEKIKELEDSGIVITAEVRAEIRHNMIKDKIEGISPRVFRERIQAEALKAPETFGGLDEQKIRELGIRGTIEQRKALAEASISQEYFDHIDTLENRVRLARLTLDHATADRWQEIIDKMEENCATIYSDANFQGL